MQNSIFYSSLGKKQVTLFRVGRVPLLTDAHVYEDLGRIVPLKLVVSLVGGAITVVLLNQTVDFVEIE